MSGEFTGWCGQCGLKLRDDTPRDATPMTAWNGHRHEPVISEEVMSAAWTLFAIVTTAEIPTQGLDVLLDRARISYQALEMYGASQRIEDLKARNVQLTEALRRVEALTMGRRCDFVQDAQDAIQDIHDTARAALGGKPSQRSWAGSDATPTERVDPVSFHYEPAPGGPPRIRRRLRKVFRHRPRKDKG